MKNETGARWIVVDDDADALDTIARLLASLSDAEIWSFRSPWQALDAIAAEPDGVFLVLTDYEMPGMNGVEFRRQVQLLSPRTKVLLATGSGSFSDESAREIGFCGLLSKPFSIGALKEILTNVTAARL